MDWYLSEEHCYERLKSEYKEHGKLIFCVDFDDTLYDYHGTGKSFAQLIDLLHRWEDYSEVIILTGNGEEEYPKIKKYLEENHIKYKGINCQSSVPVTGRKVYGNVYIDDRGGLPFVYKMLDTLIKEIDQENLDRKMVGIKNQIVKWIQDWFEKNGKGCKAVVGISGGKDSSIVAALCVEALGRENVFGVLMPNGEQFDIDVSHKLVEHLGIESAVINIKDAYDGVVGEMMKTFDKFEGQAKVNLPPRLRMSVLYAVSQTVNGRVANTCNLSEDWVGYATRYGDGAGDFSPLSRLTVQEVKSLGRVLGLPNKYIEKVPIDGLCGKTDEDNLGFTYEVLDKYIRTGICDDPEIKAKIDDMHEKNLFKLQLMDCFIPEDLEVGDCN